MARTMTWGVLSTAKIGTEHVIPAMMKGERTRVEAIASRNRDTAAAVAAKLGIPKFYGSYEELLADPSIEAVYNPLPNNLHVPWTLKALEAGKHVLCEKPIALTATEAETLLEASRRTGRLVAEAFMVRHHPQWLRVKALVEDGRIGTARAIQTTFSFYLTDPQNIRSQPETGGGGLYDIGCYAINTSRFVFGAEPDRVIGLFDLDPVMKVDRLMSGLAEFPASRHLAFVCSTQAALTQRVTVLGTKGRLEVEIPFNAPTSGVTRLVFDDGRDLLGGGREVIEMPSIDQYTLQGDAFARAAFGEEPFPYDLANAIANMKVIDAFFRSGQSGGWERP